MIILEVKYFSDMGQQNDFQDVIDKKSILCKNLEYKLTEQEVIITGINCELDKYKTIRDNNKRRIQEMKTAFGALKNIQVAERAGNKGKDEKLQATNQLMQYKYQQLKEENNKLI